ncbi:halocyanin domain-containing protein [Salinirubrum litoreum]|uniref:Halocyanin domain-containing protein n=1 Tax=Salinirubrum litoreum TaxID=1126234 RepID=A0ABD5RAV3_9EURY|nr:halocyanin domain-containing protein [Salinirubrum litoreum]
MSSPHTDPTLTRRTLLRGATGATAASLAATAATPVAGQEDSEPNYGGWFDTVSNYDGTVDKRGQSEVTITVGAEGNNGNYAFGPAAVRVDPGTTVVWEWSGKGNAHNVVAEDGSFESELSTEAGHTYEQTFEETGLVKYACLPHKAMGMKGAVVVGDPGQIGGSGGGQSEQSTGPEYGGWFENVGNFDGTADRTGESEITITVGAEGNNGTYAFDPPAVRVDPGTTVVWEWSGKGNAHNVVAEDGSFESELTTDAGHTFEQTFEATGVYKYACVPHEMMGMKGVVVVGGRGSGGGAGESSGYDFEDLFALGSGLGLVGALFATFALGSRNSVGGPEDHS